jgi:hypothetical protein
MQVKYSAETLVDLHQTECKCYKVKLFHVKIYVTILITISIWRITSRILSYIIVVFCYLHEPLKIKDNNYSIFSSPLSDRPASPQPPSSHLALPTCRTSKKFHGTCRTH